MVPVGNRTFIEIIKACFRITKSSITGIDYQTLYKMVYEQNSVCYLYDAMDNINIHTLSNMRVAAIKY